MFQKGDYYSLNEHFGFVNFIDKDYITLVLNEWEKREELQIGACSKYQQVNLLVYSHQWKDMVKSNKQNRYFEEVTNNEGE
tara:strand:- start:3940 stop:4182 length:243 start_codon:yes stop_codon:yes gene_type:complete